MNSAIDYAQGLVDDQPKFGESAIVVGCERKGIGRAIVYLGDGASWEVVGLFGHEINCRLTAEANEGVVV